MPLKVDQESVFCLDFSRERGKFTPFEETIPGLVYRKKASNRLAFVFHSENVNWSHERVVKEMEQLAGGFLSAGLSQSDRILICGNNHSSLLIATLAAARAGLIFAIVSPNFADEGHLRHLLSLGDFRAIIIYGDADKANTLLLKVCPELRQNARGHLKSKSLPKLTHVIYADENHKHAGTYTVSELFVKGTREFIEKLPNFNAWSCHDFCAIQFTMGSTGLPKAIGLTHYQLINGARIAADAIGIKKETILCCALPMSRIPVFSLVAFCPFLIESQTIFSEPSPLPKELFYAINKYGCTNLLSNAAALRLLLRTAVLMHKDTKLPSIDTVILLGERVSSELLTSIETVMQNAKRIAVGMLSSELGAIPILSDNTTNLVRQVGKLLEGYEIDIEKIEKLATTSGLRFGELKLKPLAKTKFVGYGPKFTDDPSSKEWINTGDVVCISEDGNVEIVTQHTSDLIFDRCNKLIEHWKIERALAQIEQIKGVQVVQAVSNGPIIAVIIPKSMKDVPSKSELVNFCHENNVKIAIVIKEF